MPYQIEAMDRYGGVKFKSPVGSDLSDILKDFKQMIKRQRPSCYRIRPLFEQNSNGIAYYATNYDTGFVCFDTLDGLVDHIENMPQQRGNAQ